MFQNALITVARNTTPDPRGDRMKAATDTKVYENVPASLIEISEVVTTNADLNPRQVLWANLRVHPGVVLAVNDRILDQITGDRWVVDSVVAATKNLPIVNGNRYMLRRVG